MKVQNKDKKVQIGKKGGAPTSSRHVSMASITMDTSVPEARLSPAPKELGRARGCVWTLFAYEGYLTALQKYAEEECSYAVWGYEVCPDTKRPHLQGYVHWDNPRSLGAFSKMFGNCHVEAPIRTPRHNREYCLKIRVQDKTPNTKYEEYGVLPVQGHRTDWDKALQDLKTKDVIDVLEEQPHLVAVQRALREVKSMFLKPIHRAVNVIAYYGDAGSGKTRYAYDTYTDVYKKSVGDWWDGYSGQKVILLDDFYGWIKYHELLHVLDRYPYHAPVKGGFVWAQWDTVIITSNKPPSEWYSTGLTPALRRRLNKVFRVQIIDGVSQTQELPQEAQSDPEEAHGT